MPLLYKGTLRFKSTLKFLYSLKKVLGSQAFWALRFKSNLGNNSEALSEISKKEAFLIRPWEISLGLFLSAIFNTSLIDLGKIYFFLEN